jgi:hypothetical protein
MYIYYSTFKTIAQQSNPAKPWAGCWKFLILHPSAQVFLKNPKLFFARIGQQSISL